MRRLLLMFLLPAGLCASVMDDAAKELQIARDRYKSHYEKNADEIAKLAAEADRLRVQADLLESELAALRAQSADLDTYSQTASLKNAKFVSLRADALKLQEFLSDRGVVMEAPVSNDKSKFVNDAGALIKAAAAEARPDAIFYKIAANNPQAAVDNYNAGRAQWLEIDPTMGKLVQSRYQGMLERFKAGGVWMYPILGFGLAALVIGCVKCALSFKAKRAPKRLVPEIGMMLSTGRDAEAESLAAKAPYPYRDMLVSLVKNRHIDKPLLEEMSYEHMLNVGEKLYSGLGFISVTAAVSPLLGLLGTVTGIIKTFGDLSLYGAGNARLMSEGISEALITTEFGLIVAIPAIVVHALLSRRAKAVLSDMEKLAAAFLSRTK